MDPVEERLLEVKAGLVGVWSPGGKPVGLLKAILDHEPLKAPKLPLLTMQTRGFQRARLGHSEIRRPIQDPIGGRRWVWKLWVRVWVGFKTDVAAAQRTLDVLIPQVVVALEADRTLGGVSVDAALEEGDVAIVKPKAGNAVLMCSMPGVVETEEPLS